LRNWKLAAFLVLFCLPCDARSQDLQSVPDAAQSAEVQTHIQRVRAALARNDLRSASREYAEILKIEPRNSAIYAAQGVTLYGLGEFAQAATALENALRLNPALPTAEVFLALSKSDLGQCDTATPLLRKHFDEPNTPKLRRLVGLSLFNCYIASSKFDDAWEVGRSLKRLYPDDADVLYNMAELYTRLWDVTTSELMKAHPESYRVHQLAGEVLEAQGRTEQAIKEYGLALQQNSKVPHLHYRIGRLTLKQGESDRREKAMNYFRQELTVNPGDPASEYSLGEIDQEEHRFADAEQHYRRALSASPQLTQARLGLAKTLLAEKRPEESLRELAAAVRLDPDDPALHYTLMLVYRELGKSNDAMREMAQFEKLQAQKRAEFDTRLQELLKGKAPGSAQSQ